MKLIVWNASYEGGTPEIDHQHQKMEEHANLINQISELDLRNIDKDAITFGFSLFGFM